MRFRMIITARSVIMSSPKPRDGQVFQESGRLFSGLVRRGGTRTLCDRIVLVLLNTIIHTHFFSTVKPMVNAQ